MHTQCRVLSACLMIPPRKEQTSTFSTIEASRTPSLYEPRPGLAFSLSCLSGRTETGAINPPSMVPLGLQLQLASSRQEGGQAGKCPGNPPPPPPHQHAQHHAQHYTCRSVALAVQPLTPSRMPWRRSTQPWYHLQRICRGPARSRSPLPSSRLLPLAGG